MPTSISAPVPEVSPAVEPHEAAAERDSSGATSTHRCQHCASLRCSSSTAPANSSSFPSASSSTAATGTQQLPGGSPESPAQRYSRAFSFDFDCNGHSAAWPVCAYARTRHPSSTPALAAATIRVICAQAARTASLVQPDGSQPSVLGSTAPDAPLEATAKRKPSRPRKRKTQEATDEVDESGEPAPRPRPARRRKKAAPATVDSESTAAVATPTTDEPGTANASAEDDELSVAGTDASALQPRKRNRKRQSVIANDALSDLNIQPGQAIGPNIDPATVTMSDIAMQPGNGRVSLRGIELQRRKAAAKQAAREKEAAALRGEAVQGEGEELVDGDGEGEGEDGEDSTAAERARRRQSLFEAPPEGSTADANFSGPQVRIVNGEIVLDEATLTLDQRARTLAAADEMEIVVEADQDRFINTSSFQRKPRGPKWTAEETEFFLQKVSEFGTDFQTISYCFPGRSRNMIRNKYNRESRQYGGRLEEALNTRKTIDFEYLKKMTSANFDQPEVVLEESALDTADGPGGDRAGSPGGSRSSRAGSTSASGHQPQQRPRAGSQTKKRRRSRSAMDEGLEVIGDV